MQDKGMEEEEEEAELGSNKHHQLEGEEDVKLNRLEHDHVQKCC